MSNKLPEKIEKLFFAFKKAIEAEKEAQAFYLQTKKLCDDDVLKQVFEGFYQDEMRHERELINRYDNLRQEFDIEDER
ncbi:MAG: hypothetical protein ABH868_00305 [bacterium]